MLFVSWVCIEQVPARLFLGVIYENRERESGGPASKSISPGCHFQKRTIDSLLLIVFFPELVLYCCYFAAKKKYNYRCGSPRCNFGVLWFFVFIYILFISPMSSCHCHLSVYLTFSAHHCLHHVAYWRPTPELIMSVGLWGSLWYIQAVALVAGVLSYGSYSIILFPFAFRFLMDFHLKFAIPQ